MSIGSLGIVGSVAGSAVGRQIKGDVDKAREAVANQQRQVHADAQAEDAAGIGQTDGENHETNDRDADGRTPYEPPASNRRTRTRRRRRERRTPTTRRTSLDPTGRSGSQLDLTG